MKQCLLDIPEHPHSWAQGNCDYIRPAQDQAIIQHGGRRAHEPLAKDLFIYTDASREGESVFFEGDANPGRVPEECPEPLSIWTAHIGLCRLLENVS